MTNRRRTLIVRREQQLRFVFACALAGVLLLNLLLLTALLTYPALLRRFDVMNTLALVGAEIFIVALISYFSLLVSHRIAGPTYAIARDLRRIRHGDLTVRTKLRQGDFLVEAGRELRETTEALCERITRIKTLVRSLQDMQGCTADARILIDQLQHELAQLKTEAAKSGPAPEERAP